MMKLIRSSLVLALVVGFTAATSHAQVTLNDLASSATLSVNPNGGGPGSGLTDLQRNNPPGTGFDQIDDLGASGGEQWYIGVSGSGVARPVDDFEAGSTVGTLESPGTLGEVTSHIDTKYGGSLGGSDLEIDLHRSLDGTAYGDYGTTLDTILTVRNTGNSAVTLKLYKFLDTNLTHIIGNAERDPPDLTEQIVFSQNNQVRITDTFTGTGHPGNGVIISEADILITVPGDTNGDAVVGFADLNNVLNTFTGTGAAGFVPGDNAGGGDHLEDPDGTVGFDDLNAILNNFTKDATPDFTQAGGDGAILGTITSGGDLNNNASASDAIGEDLAAAFEWEFTLDPGESFTVRQNLDIIPEPTSFGIVGLGVGLMAVCRRRRAS
jgi:hypothetical protein